MDNKGVAGEQLSTHRQNQKQAEAARMPLFLIRLKASMTSSHLHPQPHAVSRKVDMATANLAQRVFLCCTGLDKDTHQFRVSMDPLERELLIPMAKVVDHPLERADLSLQTRAARDLVAGSCAQNSNNNKDAAGTCTLPCCNSQEPCGTPSSSSGLSLIRLMATTSFT